MEKGISSGESHAREEDLENRSSSSGQPTMLCRTVSLAGHYRFVHSDGFETSAGQFVVLDPDSWIGERWPLLAASDLENDLTVGEWDVLLFRHDCHVCHNVMLELEQTLSEWSAPQKLIHVL